MVVDRQESCPGCHSGHVVKNGKRKRRQQYKCQDCRAQFVSREGLDHHFPVEVIAAAVGTYHQGASYRETARCLEDWFEIHSAVSTQTVHQWVRRYTDAAVREVRRLRTFPGEEWMVYHMWCSAGHSWMVIDLETYYILAAGFRFAWDVEAVREVLRGALAAAAWPRERVVSCVFRLSDFYGLDAVLIKGVNAVTRQELPRAAYVESEDRLDPEWAQGQVYHYLPDWGGAPDHRGRFGSIEAGQRCLDAAVIGYNFFIVQERLGNRTPGQAAGVYPPFEHWLDVVKMGPGGEAAGQGRPTGRRQAPAR